MIKFMNLDDPLHEPIVSIPGLPMKYNKRTKLAMAIWAIIFSGPFLAILILMDK